MTISEDLEFTLERAETLVLRTQTAFERAVRVLEYCCKELEAMPDAGEAEVMKGLKTVNTAMLAALDMQEKSRVAGYKHLGGGRGSGTLDLDAAREEIYLRLACLRQQGDGGGVSCLAE